MPYRVPHYINGKHVAGAERMLDIYNPATGEQIGNVGVADKKVIEQAIDAATTAFNTWSKTSIAQKTKILFRFKNLLDIHTDELAALITKEHGKTKIEARGSIQRGIDVVDFACGIGNLIKGDYSDNVSTAVDCYTFQQPLGICVGITPFNFPGMIPLWMFPLAIACGNTFILKPSEKDPSCAVKLAELVEEAGVPAGVVNVVHGDQQTVEGLIKHREVRAISFVGSSKVAEQVYHTGILHGKRVQAFGGAKNHCVVMPDANMQATAEAIVQAAYGCAGERCMAISVVVAVGDQVADNLVADMMPLIRAINIGNGDDPDVTMGPLVTSQHWQRVKSYIDMGQQEGATLVIDGSEHDIPNNKGFYMPPCLFDHVKPKMRFYQDEIFGPVLSVVRVNSLKEAVDLINRHEYGNGTAIFTEDGSAARTFVETVQVGMVGVNIAVPVPVAYHSFGGWKHSIFADIGMYGLEAIRFYTKGKKVMQRWLK